VGQAERIARAEEALAVLTAPGSLRDQLAFSSLMTPILIASEADATLADLLDSTGTAMFDLDGDGLIEEWPWLRPDTGILVWDPLDQRRITSGHQLFGSVSFFLFPRDGYEALRLLDNDQDGCLTGSELRGLAVWFDRDGDGSSSRDEVRPVAALGITAVNARADGNDPRSLRARRGVIYDDGRVVPTFDWVTEPIGVAAVDAGR
jgi:hypothetical protein